MQQSLKLAFAIVSIHTVTRRQRILTLSEATQTTSTLLHSPEPPPTTTGTYRDRFVLPSVPEVDNQIW